MSIDPSQMSEPDLLRKLIGKQAEKLPENVSLIELRPQTPGELVATYGLTPVAAAMLSVAMELGRRAQTNKLIISSKFNKPEDVFNHFGPMMKDVRAEQFWVMLLDGKHCIIRIFMVSQGTLTSSPVHPREVFGPAVRHSAAALVLVHNHPSGDPSPSADDLDITTRLCDVGRLIGIRVVDHVIIGDGTFTSLGDRGLISR